MKGFIARELAELKKTLVGIKEDYLAVIIIVGAFLIFSGLTAYIFGENWLFLLEHYTFELCSFGLLLVIVPMWKPIHHEEQYADRKKWYYMALVIAVSLSLWLLV